MQHFTATTFKIEDIGEANVFSELINFKIINTFAFERILSCIYNSSNPDGYQVVFLKISL